MKKHSFIDEPQVTTIIQRLGIVCLIILLITIIALILQQFGVKQETMPVVYLVGVTLCTFIAKGYLYGVLSCIISLVVFNYVFTLPKFEFAMLSYSDLVLYLVFLFSALISGYVSSKLQKQTRKAQMNEQAIQHIFDITESFSQLTGIDAIIAQAKKLIQEYCQCEVTILLESLNQDESVYQQNDDLVMIDLHSQSLNRSLGKIQVDSDEEITQATYNLLRIIAQEMTIALERELVYIERENIRLDYEREKMKSVLLRSVSHDIRTPLTGIMGASSLILDNVQILSDQEIKKLAADIKDESSWLMQSVTNILDMTRISEGKMIVNRQWEMVYDLISQAISRFPRLSEEKRLQVDIPDEQMLLVEVDGKLMVSVLYNLLDNAFKHGGKDCQVILKEYQQGSNCIIEVSDDGVGMSEEILDHCFDEFVTPLKQGDENRGMGLGLSLCRAIVEANGGTIQAESKPNEGTKFTITLPCKEIDYE